MSIFKRIHLDTNTSYPKFDELIDVNPLASSGLPSADQLPSTHVFRLSRFITTMGANRAHPLTQFQFEIRWNSVSSTMQIRSTLPRMHNHRDWFGMSMSNRKRDARLIAYASRQDRTALLKREWALAFVVERSTNFRRT